MEAPMTETIHPHALTAIRRALESRIPKLELLSGTPQETVLRRATRGEVISDNDCVFDFEALDNGVYIRLQVECAGSTDHRWVFLCKSDDLADILARRLQAANADEQSPSAWPPPGNLTSGPRQNTPKPGVRRADGKSETACGWRRGL
jgi:hypothetical protein